MHDKYRDYTIDQLLQELGTSAAPGGANSVYLENLLSVRTAEMVNKQLAETARTIGDSAHMIRASIGDLTTALKQSGTDLEAASKQSVRLGRRLNLLTTVLVVPALIIAAATTFYAVQTERLVDLTKEQLRRTQPALQSPRNSPPPVTPKR